MPAAQQVASPGVAAAPDGVTPSPTPTVTLDRDKVLARLAKVSRTGIGASGVAVMTDAGTLVAGRDAHEPLTPASTMKVLTTLATLDTLGADRTFSTRVVSPAEGKLVLVGGGDPLLTDKASTSADQPASLQALAKATAAQLAASGVKKVSLGYDATLFAGPDFSPAWKSKWRSFLSRVSPLLINEGRFNDWQSDPKPALTAATAFAKRLKAAGITVTGVRAAKAPASAEPVASVDSAPLGTIIGHTLRFSDNLAAEVLARQLALAVGDAPSFTGATTAVKSWLVAHDLWDPGMRLVDGSGLSDRSRVTPAVLAGAIATSLGTESLGAVAEGLPVAGQSGTLKDRFNDASERIARGNVHAKTGTLTGIGGLAGYLTTADGARVVFAELANHARGETTAHNWLDRTAATLVGCGCS